MFYIRADGNTQIGMGHVMRCLSIAEAAAAHGAEYEPLFLVADESCCSMIEERGFHAKALHTDYTQMMGELAQLKTLLHKERDILLVDSYQADAAYFAAVSEMAFTVCLEDMGEPYPVNLLVNYNLYAPKLGAQYSINGKALNTLLGVAYMPLRSVFQSDTAYTVKDKVTDVMITTGGSDPYFAAGAFMDAFLSAQDSLCGSDNENPVTWHIVSGPFNAYAGKLKELYGKHDNIVIHEGLKDLKALMQQCDVVLTATGSTVYEVSALGVPMIAFYFAENQRQGARELAELTDIVNAGCFSADREAVTDRAVKTLKKCIYDKNYRMLLHEQERRLIDGKGAGRIVDGIFRLWEELYGNCTDSGGR